MRCAVHVAGQTQCEGFKVYYAGLQGMFTLSIDTLLIALSADFLFV